MPVFSLPLRTVNFFYDFVANSLTAEDPQGSPRHDGSRLILSFFGTAVVNSKKSREVCRR